MNIALTAGRIFRRTNLSGIGLLGVVEVPEALDTECIHSCIFQEGALLVDGLQGSAVKDIAGDVVPTHVLREQEASGMFYRQFGSNSAGGQQLFFRQTVLPSSTPGMKWCYVVGARSLELPQIDEDGLYQLGAQLSKITVACEFGHGMSLGQLLREPVWGPGGEYGLSHSVELSFYPQWVADERARNARSDPQFTAFLKAMALYGDEPMYYTIEQREVRDAIATMAIDKILAEEDGIESPGDSLREF